MSKSNNEEDADVDVDLIKLEDVEKKLGLRDHGNRTPLYARWLGDLVHCIDGCKLSTKVLLSFTLLASVLITQIF